MKGPARLLGFCCLCLLPWASIASRDGRQTTGIPRPAAYRRLMQEVANVTDAADYKQSIEDADGEPGRYTDWVVACEPDHQRCPSLYLASWGFQCTNTEGTACCLQPTGKFCTSLSRWEDFEEPEAWQGRDMAGQQAAPSPSPASEGGDGGDGTAPPGSAQEASRSGKRSGGSGDGGSRWREATATYFNSYPACCTDESADQTECEDYSGCKYAGLFSGVDGKQSRSWVREHNIASFFEAGRADEWDERWSGKTLRLRNPRSGDTMDVQVVDTCADSDCSGCCSANANRHGGFLVDLEYHTAKRFWGGHVVDESAIEWQVVSD